MIGYDKILSPFGTILLLVHVAQENKAFGICQKIRARRASQSGTISFLFDGLIGVIGFKIPRQERAQEERKAA